MKFTRLITFFALGASAVWPLAASAQMGPRPRPGGRPAGRPEGGRPNGPPPRVALDENSARELLEKIDEPRNAVTLQLNLFMRPSGDLTPDESFALVEAQIARETAGSVRWAMLHNLRAFGGFHIPGFNEQGNDSYLALFQNVTPAAAPIVASAVGNWASSVTPRGITRGDTSSSLAVAVAAFEAWLLAPANSKVEPDWREVNDTFPIENAVDQKLKTVGVGNDLAAFRTYLVALDLALPRDPETALELLEAGDPLAAKVAPDNAKWSALAVQTLAENQQIGAAVARQQKLVEINKTGYDRLLLLAWKKGDAALFDGAVSALQNSEISEEEVFAATGRLRRLGAKTGLNPGEAAEQIAQFFMDDAARSDERRMAMRLNLARILYRNGKRAQAVAILDDAPEIVAPDGVRNAERRAESARRSLEKMKQEMADGKYYG